MYDTIAFSLDGKLLAKIVDHRFWISDTLPKKDIRDGPLAGCSLCRAGGVACAQTAVPSLWRTGVASC